MEIKLSTTTAIQDKMKVMGKDHSLRSRTTMFKDIGLEERLGTYVGSKAQNMAFMRELDNPKHTGEIK